eukprot:Ihof_evm10s99 gene=Ihof_evmTU10s99
MAQPDGSLSLRSETPRPKGLSDIEVDDKDIEDENEDEVFEPRLKYQRLLGDIPDILNKDYASCMATCDRFLALGTHWGLVIILDFTGNVIKRFAVHTKKVTAICIDDSLEYIGSCGLDGKAMVTELYSAEETMTISHNYPVMGLGLPPDYKKERRFVEGGGDGRLLMNEKGWLSVRSKELHSGEGVIYAIKWRGKFIAWANSSGVHIWDTVSEQRISYINRPADAPPPDAFRCHLCWASDSTLLIGWGDFVKVAVVKERAIDMISLNLLPLKYAEIVAMFRTDYWVTGIAPYGNDCLTILGYFINEDQVPNDGVIEGPVLITKFANIMKQSDNLAPELCIVNYKNEEIAAEQLSVLYFNQCNANDYTLGYLGAPGEEQYFIVSPKDIIMCIRRGLDDHIDWLLEKGKYEEALKAVEEGVKDKAPTKHSVNLVGLEYMEELFIQRKYDQVGTLCPRVLLDNDSQWVEWTFRFAEAECLQSISPYIPINNPRLDSKIYDGVLAYFLLKDSQGLRDLVLRWPSHIYDTNLLVNSLEQRATASTAGQNDPVLLHTLAYLYEGLQRVDQALHIYLQLQSGDVFAMIRKYKLFNVVQSDLVLLMNFNCDRAVTLLIEYIDDIPIERVVGQLQDEPRFLFKYLHALFIKNQHLGSSFHDQMVAMYAQYDYLNLMPFLRQSNYYALEKAFKVCDEMGLVSEMIFLLGRMGNHKEALHLIIERLQDVEQAIEFVKQQNDNELWDDLITYSMDKPQFIKGLLHNIGTHVDPIVLIKRIPTGMEIPGLRDALVKIMQDYNLQVSVREGCNNILGTDCLNLMDRLLAARRRGCCVRRVPISCEVCGGSLQQNYGKNSSVVVFYCQHVVHRECLGKPTNTETEVMKG